jgi:hypothetical protein
MLLHGDLFYQGTSCNKVTTVQIFEIRMILRSIVFGRLINAQTPYPIYEYQIVVEPNLTLISFSIV